MKNEENIKTGKSEVDNSSSVFGELKKDFSNQVGDEIKKASKKIPLKKKIIFVIIILAVFCATGYFAFDKLFVNKGHQVYTVSQSTLTDVIELSNLSTLEFTYNAVVTAFDDEQNGTVKYYVSYEGIVSAGIDLQKINVSMEDNIITITLPDATIQNVNVDPGTMDFIFSKKKYNTQDVPSEAYKLCKKDLENRAKDETDLLKVAKENAVSAIVALIKPWVMEVSSEYVVEVK